MLFSYRQFEQTKNSLIKQFQKQPNVSNKNDESFILYQFNKLLNKIKFEKTKQKPIHVQINSTRNSPSIQSYNLKRCTTARNLKHPKTTTKGYSRIEMEKNKQIDKLLYENKQKVKQNDKYQDFYLTSFCLNNYKQNMEKRNKIQINDNNQLNTNKFVTQQIYQQKNNQLNLEENTQNIINLKVKIFQLSNQKQYLNLQIQQLQQSIRHFQGLNCQLQRKLTNHQIKENYAARLTLKKQSDLNSVSTKNKYYKEKFSQIYNIFNKQLKSIKTKRCNEAKKCQQMIDDVSQQILTYKYLKSKINLQKTQIAKLQQKNRYKCKKIDQSKKIQNYAQILLKINIFSNFLKYKPYGKLNDLQKLIQNINNNQVHKLKQQFNIDIDYNESLKKYNQINYYQLTKQILKVYIKLTYDQQKLKQNYQQKIKQLQKNQKILYQKCILINQLNQSIQINKQNNKKLCSYKKLTNFDQSSINKKLNLITITTQNNDNDNVSILFMKNKNKIIQTNLLDDMIKNCKQLNQNIILIQQRIRFFIKKLIRYLQYISQKWLKFDQSAHNYLRIFNKRFIQIKQLQLQYLSYLENKQILKSYFENWQHYIFFLDEISQNILIKKFLNKQKYQQILRRIIKTKQKYPKIKTNKIFIKSIQQLHKNFIDQNQQKIFGLLNLGVDIIQYCSKFQVLVVNNFDKISLNININQDKDKDKIKLQKKTNILENYDNQNNTNSVLGIGIGIGIGNKETEKKQCQKNIIKSINTNTKTRSNYNQSQKSSISFLSDQQSIPIQIQSKTNKKEDSNFVLDLILGYKQQINNVTRYQKQIK